MRMEDFLDDSAGELLVGVMNKSRRIKRAVPDTEKDEQYWKRRCKNNVAAKKSRENRRKHEFKLQNQVLQLEQENALLKKELKSLRKKLNMPADETTLSASDRKECLNAFWLKPDLNVSESSGKSLLCNAQIKEEKADNSCAENSKPLSEMFNYLPQFNLMLAHTQSGHLSNGNHSSSYDVTSGNMLQTYSDPITELESIRDSNGSKDGDDVPTDLTTKKTTHRIVLSIPPDDRFNREVTVLNKNDLKRKHDGVSEDDEIKTKLQILSDQVEKMQRLVCDIDSVSR